MTKQIIVEVNGIKYQVCRSFTGDVYVNRAVTGSRIKPGSKTHAAVMAAAEAAGF